MVPRQSPPNQQAGMYNSGKYAHFTDTDPTQLHSVREFGCEPQAAANRIVHAVDHFYSDSCFSMLISGCPE